jgi:serine/threonine protein kinase
MGLPAPDEDLLGRLPLPLAQLARRAHNAKAAADRHYAAFYLWEAALKLLVSAAVVEYAERGESDPALADPLRRLARPALGDWRALARLLPPALARADEAYRPLADLLTGDRPRTDLPRLAGLDSVLREELAGKPGGRSTVRVPELLDRLVELRNKDAGHGAAGMRPEDFYERSGPALLAGALELLGRCDVLAGASLAFTDDVRRQASGDWLVGWSVLAGEAPRRQESLAVPEAEAARLPRPGRVYLHRPGPGGGAWRELHPLVVFEPGGCRVFFLNARRGGRRAEYLCYITGKPEPRDDLGAERRALLARALGMPVAEADEDAWAAQSLAGDPAPPPVAPGEARRTVGEFELVSELGRGNMGVVYRAVQPSRGRQVALKVIGHLGDPQAEARFAREIRALGRVDHPNLVKVFTEGKDDLRWYFAMELVAGADLAAVCGRLSRSTAGAADWDTAVGTAVEERRRGERPLSAPVPAAPPEPPPPEEPTAEPRPAAELGAGYVRQGVELVRQVALAAHALHEAGVVHRDVKPGNVLVTADGRTAVLADLGIAQLADEAEGRLTRTRQFVGTPRYASPEQVLATAKVDRRTDVYALGATLWELLTLRPIYAATDRTPTPEVFRRVQVVEPGPARRHNPRVPRDLDAVVGRCLEKDADRRYATAAELAADLERWLADEPVLAQPPSLRYLLGKQARRYRMPLAIAAGVLLAAAAGVALAFLQIKAAKDEAVAALGRESDALTREKEARGAVEAKEKETNAALSREQAAVQEQKGLLSEAARLDAEIADQEYQRDNPAASLNWLLQAFETVPKDDPLRPSYLRLIGGHTQKLGRLLRDAGEVNVVAFSPDGRLALTGGLGGARVWDAASGRPVAELRHGGAVRAAAFSPDGRLALTGGDDGARVWDAASGRPVAELSHGRAVRAVAFSPDGRLALTGGLNGTASLWKLPPTAPNEPDRLRAWVRVRTGKALSAQGQLVVLSQAEWQEQWRQLEALGGDWQPRPDGRAWHRVEATEAEWSGQWFAAAFHLNWLLRQTPADPELHLRLAIAEWQLDRWLATVKDAILALVLPWRNRC